MKLKLAFLMLTSLLPLASAQILQETFDLHPLGTLRSCSTELGELTVNEGKTYIQSPQFIIPSQALGLEGSGEDTASEIEIKLASTLSKKAVFSFVMATSGKNGIFEIIAVNNKGKEHVCLSMSEKGKDKPLPANIGNNGNISATFDCTIPADTATLLMRLKAPAGFKLVLDNLTLTPEGSGGVIVQALEWPAMIRMEGNGILRFEPCGIPDMADSTIIVDLSPTDNLNDIESVSILTGTGTGVYLHENRQGGNSPLLQTGTPFSQPQRPAKMMQFRASPEFKKLNQNTGFFWVSVKLKPTASLDRKVGARLVGIKSGNKTYAPVSKVIARQRVGYAVCKSGDPVFSKAAPKGKPSLKYRIPGMVKAANGDLVAVFDARYDRHNDMAANIHIGCTTSSDQGQTWTPIKAAVNYTGTPENPKPTEKADFHRDYGASDPSILLDETTGWLWVACLARKGLGNSGPGLTDDKTGQFVLACSKDNGQTWGEPISINFQCKDEAWSCFFQGPGHGITMAKRADGTRPIVFPAQIWYNGPRSCLVYSLDQGKTWKCEEQGKDNPGIGASTSEAQVVQLADGSLMINARHESRSGKRAVFVTSDMGKTWTPHKTNLNTLVEPVCQASILNVPLKDHPKGVFFFSNPAEPPSYRMNMAVRYSTGEGNTWSERFVYDQRPSCGYSDVCPVDEEHLGVLYEAIVGDETLFFLKLPYKEILKANQP